jgi:hypothetical protein
MHVQPFLSVVICSNTSNLLAGCMFSHSRQWSHSSLLKHWRETHNLDVCSALLVSVLIYYSNTGEQLTRWLCVQPFSSAVLICSNTRKQLTSCIHVQPFSSVVLICSNLNTGEKLTCWMHVQTFSSGILIRSLQVLESDLHAGHVFSILVSGSNLLKHWRMTHILDTCSAIHVSVSGLLKHWRATHTLDVQPFLSAILISSNTGRAAHTLDAFSAIVSGSDLLKHWRATHILDAHSAVQCF